MAAVGVLGGVALLGGLVVGGEALHAHHDRSFLDRLAHRAVLEGQLLPRLALGLLCAAEDVTAQRVLGATLLDSNPDSARRWLERAAQRGDAIAAFLLARTLRATGARAEAMPWLEQASRAGLSAAHVVLGNAYRFGEGVPVDAARALTHYQAAAEQEDPVALQTLAEAYRSGELGLTPDAERAEALMRDLEHAVREPRPL